LVPRDNLKPQDKVIVNELLETLKLVHGTAKTNTEITQNESKEKHDIKAKNSDFMLLELVLKKVHKHTPGLSGKLEEKWDGPFYIVAKGPNDTYKLANCKTNKVGKSFDTSRNLKRYHQPDVYRYNLMSEQTDNDPEIDNDDHVESETDENSPGTTTTESQEKQNTEKDQPETTTSNKAITDEAENKSDNTQEQNNEITKSTIPESPNENKQSKPQNRWYAVNKILKQRFRNGKKQYLLEWQNQRYTPSWQDENDVSPELKRLFHVTHTKTGKRRKRQKYRFLRRVEPSPIINAN
jgi:hypothetical protein